jgi:hypothetical protein
VDRVEVAELHPPVINRKNPDAGHDAAASPELGVVQKHHEILTLPFGSE